MFSSLGIAEYRAACIDRAGLSLSERQGRNSDVQLYGRSYTSFTWVKGAMWGRTHWIIASYGHWASFPLAQHFSTGLPLFEKAWRRMAGWGEGESGETKRKWEREDSIQHIDYSFIFRLYSLLLYATLTSVVQWNDTNSCACLRSHAKKIQTLTSCSSNASSETISTWINTQIKRVSGCWSSVYKGSSGSSSSSTKLWTDGKHDATFFNKSNDCSVDKSLRDKRNKTPRVGML